jgi:hypothetical protein
VAALSILPDPYWLPSVGSVLFLVPVQAHANRLNAIATPSHDPNARLTRWNWVGVIIGAFLELTALLGIVSLRR